MEETSDGLLDIHGAGLDFVEVSQDNQHPIEFVILCRFFKEPTEIGEKPISFKLINADGKQVGRTLDHIMQLSPDVAGAEAIVNFGGNFPPGEHSIDLFVENNLFASHPFRVFQLQDTKTN